MQVSCVPPALYQNKQSLQSAVNKQKVEIFVGFDGIETALQSVPCLINKGTFMYWNKALTMSGRTSLVAAMI